MPTLDEDRLSEFIVNAVKEHYGKVNRPFWLAELGALVVKSEEVRLPEGVQLSRFIESHLSDRLHLLRDRSDPKIIAVVDETNRERVAEAIRSRSASGPSVARVPHSLRVAFCRRLDEGERIFFRVRPPFKYVVGSQAPDSSFVEIDEKYRLPGNQVIKDVRLPDDVERRVQVSVDQWMRDKQISPDVFRSASTGRPATSGATALQRLVEAQDADVQRRLMIPADIALLLSRTK